MQRIRPFASSLRVRSAFSLASTWSPRCYSTATSTATSTPTDADADASTSGLSSTPPHSELAPPYFVPRTAGGELPVYSDIRNGGSRVYTIVRKTRGNLAALQHDLASYLTDVPSHVKPAAGQVVLRGDWVRETKEWLAAKGF
ncbi:hypothetical protein JCM3774_004059 [Rhodotorula dairenensis]